MEVDSAVEFRGGGIILHSVVERCREAPVNLSVTVAANRAFPAAVAEPGRWASRQCRGDLNNYMERSAT
jgi:hypothetical protein